MYFVYIIKSLKDGSHYTGLTDDIDRRIKEHDLGKNKATRSKKPWILLHTEMVSDRTSARLLEKYFKSGYGREVVKEIEHSLTI